MDILFFEPNPTDEEETNPLEGRGDNTLQPLTFEDGEITLFTRANLCAVCRGHLLQKPAPFRQWYAFCPKCDELICSHNYTSKKLAAQADHGEREITRQLKPKPQPTTESEILKSLGF